MPTLSQKTAVGKPADIDWAAALQADMLPSCWEVSARSLPGRRCGAAGT